MGNTFKRSAVTRFIESRELSTQESVTSAAETGVANGIDGPLDDEWLEDIRTRRAALAANPHEELARYREFFKAPQLTIEQIDGLLATMERAVGQPERFYDDL